MASPQPEPFVKFSKELLEAVIAAPMPATHKEILLSVVLVTYGDFGKKDARISQARLRRITCRAKSSLADALADLLKEGVLCQLEPPRGSRSARVGIQKDYEAWGKYTPESAGAIRDQYRPAAPKEYRPALPKEYRQSDPSLRGRREELGSLTVLQARALALTALAGDGIDCRLPEKIRDGIRAGTVTREVVEKR